MIAAHFKTWFRLRGLTLIKDNLMIAAIAGLIVVTLPVLALLLITLRAVLGLAAAVAVILGLAACAVSPGFRQALKAWTDSLVSYKGLRLATDVRFHPSHSWARTTGDVWVGVDDVLQSALGPVNGVELPPSGQHVARGDPLFRLRHDNRIVDVRSPVSGVVLGTNTALRDHPQLINDEPFAQGWAVRLRSDDPSADRKSLLRGKRARTWFQFDADRILALSPEPFPAGSEGTSVRELHNRIDENTWRQLTQTMFACS